MSGTATSIAVIVVIVVGLPLIGMAIGRRLRSMQPPLVRKDHSPRSLHTHGVADPDHVAVELTADGRDGKCAGSGERTGGRKIDPLNRSGRRESNPRCKLGKLVFYR